MVSENTSNAVCVLGLIKKKAAKAKIHRVEKFTLPRLIHRA